MMETTVRGRPGVDQEDQLAFPAGYSMAETMEFSKHNAEKWKEVTYTLDTTKLAMRNEDERRVSV